MQGVSFFMGANQILCQTIADMRDQGKKDNQTDYAVLLHVLVNGNKFDLTLDNCQNMSKIMQCFCSNYKTVSPKDVKASLNRMKGIFLKHSNASVLVFKHRSIFESVLLSCEGLKQDKLIQLMDFDFIIDRTRPEHYQALDGEVCMIIPRKNYKSLASRILTTIQSDPYYSMQKLSSSQIIRLSGEELLEHIVGEYYGTLNSICLKRFFGITTRQMKRKTLFVSHFDLAVSLILCCDNIEPIMCLLTSKNEQYLSRNSYLGDLIASCFVFVCLEYDKTKAKPVWNIIKNNSVNIWNPNNTFLHSNVREIFKDTTALGVMCDVLKDSDCETKDYEFLMNATCFSGCLEAVIFMLRKFNDYTFSSDALVSNACASGNTEVVKVLFTKFDKTKLIDLKTAMNHACHVSDNTNVVQFLLEQFGTERFDFKTALGIACKKGHIKLVNFLLNTVELDLFDSRQALEMACLFNVKESVIYATEDNRSVLFDSYQNIMFSGDTKLVLSAVQTIPSTFKENVCNMGEQDNSHFPLEQFISSYEKMFNYLENPVSVNLIKQIMKEFVEKQMTLMQTARIPDSFKNILDNIHSQMIETIDNIQLCRNKLANVPPETYVIDQVRHAIDPLIALGRTGGLDILPSLVRYIFPLINKTFEVVQSCKSLSSKSCDERQRILNEFKEEIDQKMSDLRMSNHSNKEVVILLLKHFDYIRQDMDTALKFSCMMDNVTIVRYLLDTFDFGHLNFTELINIALEDKCQKVIIFLIEKHDDRMFDIETIMNKACELGLLDVANFILQNFDAMYDKKTSINKACEFGRLDVVNLLLRQLPCNLFDSRTLLDKASVFGHTEIVRLLIKTYGYEAFEVKRAMNTACAAGYLDIVSLLVCQFNRENFDLQTSMNLACKRRDKRIVKTLIDSFGRRSFDIMHLMNEACCSFNGDMVQFLLEHFDHSGLDLENAMAIACKNESLEIVTLLLQNADPALLDLQSALKIALDTGNIDIATCVSEY